MDYIRAASKNEDEDDSGSGSGSGELAYSQSRAGSIGSVGSRNGRVHSQSRASSMGSVGSRNGSWSDIRPSSRASLHERLSSRSDQAGLEAFVYDGPITAYGGRREPAPISLSLECQDCQERFLDRRHLTRHRTTKHLGKKPDSQPKKEPCQYTTGKTLGRGTYAVVKEAVHIKTGIYYACKVINKKLMEGREHMVRNEVQVLKRVSRGHRNIVKLRDYFESSHNVYLILDLCTGGHLFERIYAKGSYFEADAAALVKKVMGAVQYMHNIGIVHRNLKPKNLLFHTKEADSDVMITGFGLGRVLEDGLHLLTDVCGTRGYMAPEIFGKTGHSKPVDIWAMGVITYLILCGYMPFARDTEEEEARAIMRGDYKFEPIDCQPNASETARDFVKKCLTVDPHRRATAAQLLEHQWLAPYFVTPHFVTNPASSNVETDAVGGGKSQNDLIGNLGSEKTPNNLLESVDDTEMELPDDFSLSPIPRVSGIPVTTLAGRPDQDLGGASRQGYADATMDVHEDQLALAAPVSLIENGYSGTVVEQVKHGKASETKDKWEIEMSGKVKLRTARKKVATARTRRGLRSDDLVAKDKSTADDNKTGRRRRGTRNRA